MKADFARVQAQLKSAKKQLGVLNGDLSMAQAKLASTIQSKNQAAKELSFSKLQITTTKQTLAPIKQNNDLLEANIEAKRREMAAMNTRLRELREEEVSLVATVKQLSEAVRAKNDSDAETISE